MDIAQQRLQNQHLAAPVLTEPGDIVRRLGAVQAQDYGGAKWGLAQRLVGATDASFDQAFNDGRVLRTHVMRPTWHFVAPEDICWLVALTAPRVHKLNAYYYRKLEMDPTVIAKSTDAIIHALEGGKQQTRDELRAAVEAAGIATGDSLRMGYLVMHAELEAIICSGPRRGKQFTYMLLDERVPQTRPLEHDEALAALVKRFFESRGPATAKDFAWWSGLTLADAQAGLESNGSHLASERLDGRTYWRSASGAPVNGAAEPAYLLPNYDEYTIAYRDHSGVFDPANLKNLVFPHFIVIDGRIVGTWRRTFVKGAAVVELSSFVPLTTDEGRHVSAAAERFGAFLGMPVHLARPDKPPHPTGPVGRDGRPF